MGKHGSLCTFCKLVIERFESEITKGIATFQFEVHPNDREPDLTPVPPLYYVFDSSKHLKAHSHTLMC